MIEYIYNAIRATAGEDICICAKITDDSGEPITANAHIMLYDGESMLGMYMGAYDAEGAVWEFVIPSTATSGLKGRYSYCICVSNSSICFKQPLYLV